MFVEGEQDISSSAEILERQGTFQAPATLLVWHLSKGLQSCTKLTIMVIFSSHLIKVVDKNEFFSMMS